MNKIAAHQSTRHTVTSGKNPSPSVNEARIQRSQFLTMSLNMSWQLALVTLVPIIGGVQLDKVMKSSTLYTFIGLGLAVLGSGLVMWRTAKIADTLPVPKLSESQRRAVRKQYDEEDED